MNEQAELYAKCELAATEIVHRVKLQYPNSEDVVAFSFGGGTGTFNQDTSFSRQGTSQTDANHILSGVLTSLLNDNSSTATVSSDTGSKQQNFLSGLITKDPTSIPGRDVIESSKAVNPIDFAGRSVLTNVANVDPTSPAYENATNDSFVNRLKETLAAVRTGSNNVRGGIARQGFREGDALYKANLERAEELRRAKVQDYGMVSDAVKTSQGVEGSRRDTQLKAQGQEQVSTASNTGQSLGAAGQVVNRWNANNANLALAAEMLGVRRSTNTEDLKGKGNQGGSNAASQYGFGCCFIFMEAYNGRLPYFVRFCRDYFYTPSRRRGYVRMSKWLVPLMQKSQIVREAVNWFMIKPLTSFGGWLTHESNHKHGWLFKPLVLGWFKLWSFMGKDNYAR